ncbi:hypothetical protein Patl1_21270 [Pistacia atlantica]|uniref:Uncharacterized protein n=1 Tax=Pistacia atlantica TaxID=434234 RepID=A0ACC1BII3_9ROSI|nr:hypothetical protein Patl1_21270 [Pistacia atlantica]
MIVLMKSAASVSAIVCLYVSCIFLHLLVLDVAQTQATTAPHEVAALNMIFEKWGISANQNQWNISGEPCSGAAVDESIALATNGYNPFIKCDCSFNEEHSLPHHQGFLQFLKLQESNRQEADGVIPDELWSLKFPYLPVWELNINRLSGQLPKELGMLSELEYLGLGGNNFSGPLPSELGNLTKLKTFIIGTNDFSGPLPSELGNLTNLNTLYIDSTGLSGEIPSSFANLKNLESLLAANIELTGRIPDFIGNWSNLHQLILMGNSFEGPIPSSFSSLINLTDLRIKVLRNNKISDSIPSNIGDYLSLRHLDLSFNNISGQIPSSLFNLDSLTYLFLGNNSLNGTLPNEKGTTLLYIDVSYNNLSGNLPSWIQEQNLQLNLVANNFNIESSNYISALPYGLNCLQRNFPCNRGSGIYSSFAINCAGSKITSHNIVYESDNERLGPATYYLTDTNRWGVSNVGYVEDDNLEYTINSASVVTNTQESTLFQTARTSASSLRYYGLGLQNGNYAVTLQFAELANFSAIRWKSLRIRVFDIYIQGNLVEKDFDITRVAGGVLRRAVQREYLAQVSKNYMEIHFFWAGKGTNPDPVHHIWGPSISAISATLGSKNNFG